MVLSFALCATFAFAQTNNSISRNSVTTAASMTKLEATAAQNAGYKGSIFTKAEGDTIASWTFNSTQIITTGTLSAADMVDTTVQGGVLEHTQTNYSSTWHRHTDTTAAYWASQSANYSVWTSRYFVDARGQVEDFAFRSPTVGDGYMVMSMLEFIPSWGGHGNVGGFNAYIKLGPITATNVPLIDIRFYQYYKKFNYDQCWVDYSTDDATWGTVEINIKNIDLSVNQTVRGWVRATLPASAANHASVYIRIRWSCASDAENGAYGYFWAVDDVMAVEGPANRLTSVSDEYFEGFYGMMPQGLQVPMVWNVNLRNTGGQTQTNIVGELKTSSNRTSGYTTPTNASVTIGSLPSLADTSIRIDPKGWYAGNGFGYNTNNPSYNQPHRGSVVCLPTTNTGLNYVYGDVHSTAHQHIRNNFTSTYDTLGYTVTPATASTPAVWAHDNGVLRKFSIWVAGMIGASTFSTDASEVGYGQAGYRIYNSYLTGDNIPSGWRIKGLQLVASTHPSYGAQGGMEIFPELRKDRVYDTLNSTYVSFASVETGANTYMVQGTDLNNLSNLEYETYGNYNVINIDFPHQPALEPNTAYRIGYGLAEDGDFAVAGNTIGYYDLIDTDYHYFAFTQNMEGYGSSVGHPNIYNTMIYDPYDQNFHFFKVGSFPMIRMLVGPYEYRAKQPVDIQCGANGNIFDQQYNLLCGQVDSVVDGASRTYIFSPEEGYMVDQIFQDGAVIFTNDTTYLSDVSYTFTIDAPTTINVTFTLAPEIEEGIDPVASNVNVNLQPNPATSNVQLTISGVEGMVDFALVDMSGRIIRSAKMDATTAQNISLAGLAKGAYFVRITNSNFSKVEKLIVR